jgi:hypothetical protein
MTEPTTPPADQTDDGQTEQQSSTYTPPATQADLDRIIADRVARTKNQFKDYAELKSAKAELDQIKQQNQTVEQRQAEELSNWQTKAQTWRTAAVGSRIEALAAEAFADPSDAAAALAGKLDGYLDAGDQINEAAIKADLEDVLSRKPHWRKQAGTPAAPRVPAPNPVQGSSGGRPVADPAQEFASLIQGQIRS